MKAIRQSDGAGRRWTRNWKSRSETRRFPAKAAPVRAVCLVVVLASMFLAAPGVAAPTNSTEAQLFAEFSKAPNATTALALAQRGEAAVPFLNRGLARRVDAVPPSAPGRFGSIRSRDASRALRPLLWQVDQVAGYWAAKALGNLPDPENVKALAALLPDERLGFWELSAGGVGRITDVFSRASGSRRRPRIGCPICAWLMRRWNRWVNRAAKKPRRRCGARWTMTSISSATARRAGWGGCARRTEASAVTLRSALTEQRGGETPCCSCAWRRGRPWP